MKITKEEKLRILKLHESYRGWNGSLIKEQIQYGRELRWYEDEEGSDDFGVGEIFNSDICGEGLADSVWDVMELLWEATDYFNPAQFSNWDENKIVKAFQSAQAKDIEDIDSVLYCYLKGISKLGKWKMNDDSGIKTLLDIAFQSHEEDEKQEIINHLKKIDPKFRVGPEMDGRDSKFLIKEIYEGGLIQQGDKLCDILCKTKYAANGSLTIEQNGVVKQIQHALAKGFGDWGPYNPTKGGGGMSQKCAANIEACDGKFKKETKQAVIEFQNDANKFGKKGLKADGIVGFNTLKALCEFLDGLTCPDCNCNEEKSGDQTGDQTGDNPSENVISDITNVRCEKVKACVIKYIMIPGPDIKKFYDCVGGVATERITDPVGKKEENIYKPWTFKYGPANKTG